VTIPRTSALVPILLLALLAGGSVEAKKKKPLPQVPQAGWGKVITSEDRVRLRDWRTTWLEGVKQARSEDFGAQVAKEGPLLDPDSARTAPEIPDGTYRCRTIKLGRKTSLGHAFRIEAPQDCTLEGDRFRVTNGIQRIRGHLWRYDLTRQILLGTVELGDERATIPYARDKERDALGFLDKVGPQRWRLALPNPSWESLVDVIEITPAN